MPTDFRWKFNKIKRDCKCSNGEDYQLINIDSHRWISSNFQLKSRSPWAKSKMGISTPMTTRAAVGAASEIVVDLNEYLSAKSNLLDSIGSEGQVRGLWWGPDDTEKSYKKLKIAQTWRKSSGRGISFQRLSWRSIHNSHNARRKASINNKRRFSIALPLRV